MDEDATDSVRRVDWSVFFRLDDDAEFLLLSDLNMVDLVRVPSASQPVNSMRLHRRKQSSGRVNN